MFGVSHGGMAAVVAASGETAFFPILVALNIKCLCQTNSTVSTIGGSTRTDRFLCLLLCLGLSREMGLGCETEGVLEILDVTMWFVSLSAANYKV